MTKIYSHDVRISYTQRAVAHLQPEANYEIEPIAVAHSSLLSFLDSRLPGDQSVIEFVEVGAQRFSYEEINAYAREKSANRSEGRE